jgi:hypothetical protein
MGGMAAPSRPHYNSRLSLRVTSEDAQDTDPVPDFLRHEERNGHDYKEGNADPEHWGC